HAHGDHECKNNQHVYSTPATASIMRLRYQKNAGHTFHDFNYEEEIVLNGVKISFLPTGHILGSAMILMEFGGIRYLYTGDYKLQADATCDPAQLVQADVLITESTFADPQVKHPDPVQEIKKLNDIPHNILLGAYAL